MRILTCLTEEHSLAFVLGAGLICFLGSLVTFSLFRRSVHTNELARLGWLFLTAVCAGSTIWTTHFISMLGYRPGASVTFEPIFTISSIIIAIFGMAVGFGVAVLSGRSTAIIIGGGFIGVSTAAMHYAGMFGYRVGGIVTWHTSYVLASVILSAGLAAAAMAAFRRWPARLWFVAPVIFAGSVVSLHFTGMAAFEIAPLAGFDQGTGGQATQAMALSVGIVALIVIGTGISSYLIDDRTRLRSDERLFHMAFHDALTGLANRRALKEQMDEAFRTQTWFKLMMIDLDHFKAVNDTYGHAMGDVLLTTVAERLRQIVAPHAFAYRLGGDELAVLVFKDRETALQMANDIVVSLSTPYTIDNQVVIVGCSIGLCAFEHADDADTLLQRADTALYEAKRRGRNQVFRYAKGMLEAIAERSQREMDLRQAIEEEQFHLAYQPIIDLQTRATLGYEALIRWHHPTLGMVSPADFIPLAEETGLIMPIGRWVIEEACRQAASWPNRQHVAVNVSALQFKSPTFLHHLVQALAQSGLAADRLEVELTETAIVADGRQVAHVLNDLRTLGVKVAMDDFGTGYSSLSHLCDLPLDRIKIDRSFVSSAVTDRNSMAVLKAITQLGRDMGIVTLGEGVETEEQADILARLGCDAAQGYLFGRAERWNDDERSAA